MEPSQTCAYNQTRECFLGLEVIAGDFSLVSLDKWMDTLTPNSGSAIWMVPFRGVVATRVHAPLDLIYLDRDCRVIDTVELYPTFRVSPSSPPAASVLALPSHSIFSSQTQPGDHLMVCSAAEMEWLMDQADESEMTANTVVLEPPHPRPQMERPEPPAPQISPLSQRDSDSPAEPAGKPTMPKRGWLKRWLIPDAPDPRRRAPRRPVTGLTAHFFTGGAPQPHDIRDISTTGLYVETAERWYPGTLIRMTLSKQDIGQHPSERSITVHAKSVRWGNDGVGLEFVLAARKRGRSLRSQFDPVDGAHLGAFLNRLTST